MTEDLTLNTESGFQVSDEPVIQTRRQEAAAADSLNHEPDGLADDSLHILARDPKSLFVYWTLDWAPRFAAAGLGDTQRQVHLRILRDDETEEATSVVDPLVGFAFVDVSLPDAEYVCELGCFDEEAWKPLARSSAAQTPPATLSEDLTADFATLPFHLSFQRLIDIFRSAANSNGTHVLAESVADFQGQARALQSSMPSGEWSDLVEAASALIGADNDAAEDVASLLQTAKEDSPRDVPSAAKLEEWRRLGERFGGSSWGGASSANGGERWGGTSSWGGSSR